MKKLTGHLYFWVLIAILIGGTFGYLSPASAVKLKPLGDGFISLVKMLISPVIFCTVVLGIAGAGDMKKVGRVGGKALLYFEVVYTFALAIGLVVSLFVSGIIEGFVTPSPLWWPVKIGIGVVALGAFLTYMLFVGRRAYRAGETGDLGEFEGGARRIVSG